MSGVSACPSQKVLQYFLSVTAQLQLGWAHFLVSAMIHSPGLFDRVVVKPFQIFSEWPAIRFPEHRVLGGRFG
jgi:hypothetical protein